jgi:hypothetical protein
MNQCPSESGLSAKSCPSGHVTQALVPLFVTWRSHPFFAIEGNPSRFMASPGTSNTDASMSLL